MLRSEYEVFLTIYEQKSLSRAADRLDKYQGALSKQLARLEEELDGPLFIRSNRGLVSTSLGHQLYKQVQSQRSLWREFRQTSKNFAHEVSGVLRVGGHSSILGQFTRLIANLCREFPKLDLQFDFDRSPQVTRKVLNHELDLGLVANPHTFDELVIRKLKVESVALYSSEKSPEGISTYNPELLTSASIVKSLRLKNSMQLIAAKDYDFAAILARELKGSAILPASIAQRFGLKFQKSPVLLTAKLCLIYRPDHRIHSQILKSLRKQSGSGSINGLRPLPHDP